MEAMTVQPLGLFDKGRVEGLEVLLTDRVDVDFLTRLLEQF